MLTLGVPLANRVEPRILGLPFLLCWIVGWIILTPLFLYGVFVLEGRAHGRFAKRRNVERPS
ncbi:MAG: DUF3311 domain-containing protein [Candidatus Eremiobacteraeota bacterium]|nr:DUF3311 domain-containing protein [Candidatus Eremiobacteraeota bacterium]MBC5827794.1 DUF3311 domain-containing protein [Candidatus Eremiobacteraeota bacterium]